MGGGGNGNGSSEKGDEDPLTDVDDGASSVVFVSMTRAAADKPYTRENSVSDDEETFAQSMRVHNKTDLEDMQQTLSLHTPVTPLVLRPPVSPQSQPELDENLEMAPKRKTGRGKSATQPGRQGAAKKTVTGEAPKSAAKRKQVQRSRAKSEEGEDEVPQPTVAKGKRVLKSGAKSEESQDEGPQPTPEALDDQEEEHDLANKDTPGEPKEEDVDDVDDPKPSGPGRKCMFRPSLSFSHHSLTPSPSQ